MIELPHLIASIRQYRYRYESERELQEGLERVLFAYAEQWRCGPLEREFRFSPQDRADFFLDGIAIEVKIAGPLGNVTRQLFRYAQHPAVRAILLVTSRSRHGNMPSEMNGKPVHILVLPAIV